MVNRFDHGLQLSIPLPLFSLSYLIADVKCKLIQRPPYYLAGGFGLVHIQAQALLIGGTENLYVGIKPIVTMLLVDGGMAFYPITIRGLTMGGKVLFLLEVNVTPLGIAVGEGYRASAHYHFSQSA